MTRYGVDTLDPGLRRDDSVNKHYSEQFNFHQYPRYHPTYFIPLRLYPQCNMSVELIVCNYV